MANFATHLAVGIIGSGALATLTLASGMVPPADIVTLAIAGSVGAILPDIDLGTGATWDRPGLGASNGGRRLCGQLIE